MVDEIVLATGTTTCYVGAVTQTNETMQVINTIITCVVGAITIAYTIYKWYKRAKSDGKITKDEVEELVEDVKKDIDELK